MAWAVAACAALIACTRLLPEDAPQEGGGGGGQPYGWPGPWPLAQITWSHLGGWAVHGGYGYWELHTFWHGPGGGPWLGELAIFRAPLGVGTSNGEAEVRATREVVWTDVATRIGQPTGWIARDNQFELRWYTAPWLREILPHVQCGPAVRIF